jgi:hypothetical protein
MSELQHILDSTYSGSIERFVIDTSSHTHHVLVHCVENFKISLCDIQVQCAPNKFTIIPHVKVEKVPTSLPLPSSSCYTEGSQQYLALQMPWKSSFYHTLPCKCGKITLKYCIVPFTKHNIPLSTLEKRRTSFVPHVTCFSMLQAETKLCVQCDCIPLWFQTTTPPASIQTLLHIIWILFKLYDCSSLRPKPLPHTSFSLYIMHQIYVAWAICFLPRCQGKKKWWWQW